MSQKKLAVLLLGLSILSTLFLPARSASASSDCEEYEEYEEEFHNKEDKGRYFKIRDIKRKNPILYWRYRYFYAVHKKDGKAAIRMMSESDREIFDRYESYRGYKKYKYYKERCERDLEEESVESRDSAYELAYRAGSNGSVSGELLQSVVSGGSGSAVTAVPNEGYYFSGWNDGVLTSERTDTNVTGNISVEALFTVRTYTISTFGGSGGSVTPSGITTKEYGSSQVYQIEADDGYRIADIVVDGESIGQDNIFEFSDIRENHVISASFELIPPGAVTVSGVLPSSGYDTRSVSLTSISGTGFVTGAAVRLVKSGEDDIDCTDVTVASDVLISGATCDITSAMAGNWNVVVTNADTGSGELVGGFAVEEYEAGDPGPMGGYIFYVNSNFDADGWKYLEAAASDQSTGAKWADNTGTFMGATATAIGSGLSNTQTVTGSSTPINSAIEYSLDIPASGPDDHWFLPSEDELNLMYANLHQQGLGGFATSSYWSSTEADGTNARRQSFGSGAKSTSSKATSYRVRAVHRFVTCPTYSISYDGNGNTGGTVPVDSDSYLIGSSVTVSGEGTLVKDGYSFDGWNTEPDGSGTSYEAGSDYVMGAEDGVLYAQWYAPNYSIVIVPDTQSYVNWKPAELVDQLDWIVSNETRSNLKFVGHVGDLVQNWDADPDEWAFVREEMGKLADAGIPYSTLPGNHDYAYMSRDSTMYDSYFPLSDFSGMPTYGGSYDTGSDNTYHVLEIDADNDGDTDDELLVLSLEFGPREAVVDWADDVLAAHSSMKAIIITHAYLEPDGDLLESGDPHAASNGYGLGADVFDGDELWNELVYPNNNVRFVFCGHDGLPDDGSAMRVSTHADSSPVYQIMANYQYYPVNQAGYLLLLNFTDGHVSMRTYSPWTDTYKTDSESQAEWDWDF